MKAGVKGYNKSSLVEWASLCLLVFWIPKQWNLNIISNSVSVHLGVLGALAHHHTQKRKSGKPPVCYSILKVHVPPETLSSLFFSAGLVCQIMTFSLWLVRHAFVRVHPVENFCNFSKLIFMLGVHTGDGGHLNAFPHSGRCRFLPTT